MSHYAVLVIGKDIESQLEPYDEGIEFERYSERIDLLRGNIV